jgi:hypothetical protein
MQALAARSFVRGLEIRLNERGLKKRVHGKDSGDLGACFEVGGGAWPPGHPCSAVPERDYSPCQTATRDDENWKSRMVTAL